MCFTPLSPLCPLQSVPAGNVLAISGLDSAILKSATLCSTPACRPLAPLLFQAAAIVKVRRVEGGGGGHVCACMCVCEASFGGGYRPGAEG